MSKELLISIKSEVIYWRGPSPFHFLKVPAKDAAAIGDISKSVSYGWGVIPSNVSILDFDFYTALIPKDGTYLVPLKKSVREALGIHLGDTVKAKIQIETGL